MCSTCADFCLISLQRFSQSTFVCLCEVINLKCCIWLDIFPFITDFHLQRYGRHVATQKLVNSKGFVFFYWSSVVVGGQPNFKCFLSVSSNFSRNSLLNIFFRLWRIRISLNTLKMNFLLDLLLEGFFARQKILSYSP